jgi:exosome complex RNA-binding protein Csl4
LAKVTLANGAVVEGSVEELMQMAKVFGAPAVELAEEEPKKDEAYRKVEGRDPKDGDFVKFDDEFAAEKSYFTVGKYYEITEIDEYGDPQIVDDDGDEYDTGGDGFKVFEKVSLDKRIKTPEVEPFKVGDYVVANPEIESPYYVTDRSMKLGKVTDTWENEIQIEIVSHEKLQEIGQDFDVDPKYFLKATDEEVAKGKRDAKFAKIGRNPDEFKKGDIVRLIEYTGADKEGTIVELGGEGTYIDAYGRTLGFESEWGELIAPVESRVDGDSL